MCAACGAPVMSFRAYALCEECIRSTGRKVCICSFPDWEPLVCPIHWGFNPYEIPY